MIGFRAEPRIIDGKKMWLIFSLKTQEVLAQGETLSEAVNNLEKREEEKCSQSS